MKRETEVRRDVCFYVEGLMSHQGAEGWVTFDMPFGLELDAHEACRGELSRITEEISPCIDARVIRRTIIDEFRQTKKEMEK